MVDWLMFVFDLCKTGFDKRKELAAIWGREPYSPRERELLLAAADKGDIRFHSSASGYYLTIGDAHFGDFDDPAVIAHYQDALEIIARRGFLRLGKRTDACIYFALNGDGFEAARKLRDDERRSES